MRLQKIALFIFVLITITTYGQTEKGKIYIGANSNLNFSSSSSSFENKSINVIQSAENINKFSQFNINAEIGYFLIDNLTSGININFSRTNPDDSAAQDIYTISPFVKYYFLNGKIKPFARISYGFGKIKDDTFITGNESTFIANRVDTDINALNTGAGLAYFLNNYFSIELIFNYSQTTYTSKTSSQTAKQVDSVFQSKIGFSIFL